MVARILATKSTSITELKRDPMVVIEAGEPVVVLNRNTPVFYCVPPELYQQMINAIEDAELNEIIEKRKNQTRVKVDVKDL